MTWEIWRLDPETERILEVIDCGDDYGVAQEKYTEMQELARTEGGTLELRRDGQYAGMFSVTDPRKVGRTD